MNSLASPRGIDFEALVLEHQGTVYHVALRVLRDPAGAEDVAQQVFLRLFQERGVPPSVASPKAYVARAAVNAALNELRARERRARHEEATPRRSTPMSPTDAALQAEVRAAVDELPVDQRLAVVLHYFQGLTHAEVAESLDVPPGTVASRIHAAVGRLREALAGAGVALAIGALEGALEAAKGEPVPGELTEKLLRIPLLPPPVQAPPAGGGAVAGAMASAMTGPFAVAMLVLATVGIALIAAARLTRSTPTRTASTPAAPTLPTFATTATPSAAAGDPSRPPMRHEPVAVSPAPADGEIETISGFLVRWEDGSIHVADLPNEAVQTMASAPNVLDPDSARAFEGIPLGGMSIMAFLQEPKSLGDAPRVCASLRGTVRHEPPKTEESFDRGVNWITVREVVALDYLTDGWLAAWKQARRGLWTIDARLRQTPARGRRDAVLATAQETLRAVEEMRRLRGLEAVPERVGALPHGPVFRRWTERELLHRLWSVTSPYGVTPVGVPEFPIAEDMRRAFLDATSQDALRAAIVSRYGEEGLDSGVRFFDGTPSEFSMTGYGLREVVETWSPERFAETQGRARAIPENTGKEAPPEHADYERHRGRIASAGLRVEDLGAIDRQTWLVTEGVKVVSVAQASRADRAGLRVGDVIWRAHVPNAVGKEGPEGEIDPHLPANPLNFGYLLGRAEGLDAVTLDVLRDGECVQVALPLK